MKVFEVSYTKRKNQGNYEHEEVTLKAQIDDSEDFMQVTAKVKFACSQALNMIVREEIPPALPPKIAEEPKKGTKKGTKRVTKKVIKKVDKKEVVEKADDVVIPFQEVKDALAGVWKAKSKEVAFEILHRFGVKKSFELKESEYSDVMAECAKAMK